MITKMFLRGLSLAIALVALFSAPTFAQNNVTGLSKKTLRKMVKTAKKEAKALKKDGWYAPGGGLPLEITLERAYNRQLEEDEDGALKYLIGSASAIGGTQIAAKNQAVEVAKLELAGLLESRIAALTENSIANEQMTQEDAVSLTETVTASKNIITQKLGRVRVIYEAHRKVGSKNLEVAVRLAYNTEEALAAAEETIREELRKKSEDLHNRLDKLLDLDGSGS